MREVATVSSVSESESGLLSEANRAIKCFKCTWARNKVQSFWVLVSRRDRLVDVTIGEREGFEGLVCVEETPPAFDTAELNILHAYSQLQAIYTIA